MYPAFSKIKAFDFSLETGLDQTFVDYGKVSFKDIGVNGVELVPPERPVYDKFISWHNGSKSLFSLPHKSIVFTNWAKDDCLTAPGVLNWNVFTETQDCFDKGWEAG